MFVAMTTGNESRGAEEFGGSLLYGENFPLLMPRWGYVASAFVLFLIGFFGFFLNLLVILLMMKDRQLWTPLNMILFNLVCSDFTVSLLGNPLTLVSALFHRWVFGHTMCVVYGFFMSLLGIASITTLTVLSFERYLMVSRPFSSNHLTSRGAIFAILFIWGYALALTTPPLFGWGNYIHEGANISCSVNWQEQTFNTLTYILFLFATGQIIPLIIITFSYYNIINTMKKNSERMGRVNKAEVRVTAMVFLMILSFMVAWTPYSVLALLEQFGQHNMVSPGVGVIPALVAKSSICYDPLIYVGMNSQFRQAIRRMFGIHTKSNYSNHSKIYHNTIMSPATRFSMRAEENTKPNIAMPSFNNITTKIFQRKKNKRKTQENADDTPPDILDDLVETKFTENKLEVEGTKTSPESTDRSGDSYVDEQNNSKSRSNVSDDKSNSNEINILDVDDLMANQSEKSYVLVNKVFQNKLFLLNENVSKKMPVKKEKGKYELTNMKPSSSFDISHSSAISRINARKLSCAFDKTLAIREDNLQTPLMPTKFIQNKSDSGSENPAACFFDNADLENTP